MSENFEKNAKQVEPQELTPEQLDGVSGGTSYSLNQEITMACDRCGKDTTWKCVEEEWNCTVFRCTCCNTRYRDHNMFGWFPPRDASPNYAPLPDD